MKKALGVIALLACSAAVTVAPAMAGQRTDYNSRNVHTGYVVDRDHGRRIDDRFRDRDRDHRYDRDDVRYTGYAAHDDGGFRR